ncbi:MAG: metallophosphoesterase [Sulfuricurvum sp.]|nr:metallophosphoesterase [Sulfuricurvum sp.]
MKNKAIRLLIIAASFFSLLLMYTFYEPYLIEIKQDTIVSKKINSKTDKLKIIFISDIHHGPFLSRERVHNLVDLVNNEMPDIIILGGDYVHRDKKYISSCFDELQYLKAKYGVYAILGNHDHWEGKELTIKNIQRAKINLLDNNASWISVGKSRIKIGGVDDYLEGVQDINPTLTGVKKEDFVILVTHNPDYIEEIKDNTQIDLVLAGHTHGGQVTFFGLYAPILPTKTRQKYRTGKVQVGSMTAIISTGVGTVTPPVRFFARPQINVITLRSE